MKILVAIDGSKNSLRALKHAIKLVGKVSEPSELLLVNAHDDVALRGASQFVGKDTVKSYLDDLSRTELADAIQAAEKSKLRFETKMLRGQVVGLFRGIPLVRHTNAKILLVQCALFALFSWTVSPWAYLIYWLVPYLTVWRVMNRLRSIAEHGGLRADDDRRVTTHSVRQNRISSFLFVPFNLGWHIAHHTDSGIPFRSLPTYHRALREAGYVNDVYEYPNYRSIWKALRSA